jgi:hypothetical protein
MVIKAEHISDFLRTYIMTCSSCPNQFNSLSFQQIPEIKDGDDKLRTQNFRATDLTEVLSAG